MSDDQTPDHTDVPLLDAIIIPDEIAPAAPSAEFYQQLADAIRAQIRPVVAQAIEESVTHLVGTLTDQIQVRIEAQIPELVEQALRELNQDPRPA